MTPPVDQTIKKGLSVEANINNKTQKPQPAQKDIIEQYIINLQEHPETHKRDLAALRNITAFKTHLFSPARGITLLFFASD